MPKGSELRQVTSEADVRALSAMQEEVFGAGSETKWQDALLQRLSRGDGMELWVAEAEGEIVSSGPPRTGSRKRVRGDLGRRDSTGMARPRHLPGPDGGARTIGASAWQKADS